MKEINLNKDAWGKISKAHYDTFKEKLENNNHKLSKFILEELGDITGKTVMHLQCNTGADTIALSKLGAKKVVGVDIVPDNIFYAKKLAEDFNIDNIDFIESDIMTLSDIHHEKYDVVFTSEGAIGWLPDLKIWAKTIKNLLNPEGFFYAFDSHPLMLMFDEGKLKDEIYDVKYPYFSKTPDENDSIGGYASEQVSDVKSYFWMYTVSDIINNLSSAGLRIEYFNEFPELFFNIGGMEHFPKTGMHNFSYNKDKYPMSFSVKAVNK